MSLSLSAVISQGINPLSSPYRSPMEDLYPKEIIDALGGVEALGKLEENNLNPDYAGNLHNCRYIWKDNQRIQIIDLPEGPSITRGLDRSSRPFLEVCLPEHEPLVYYTYTNCVNSADFTNIEKWQLGASSGSRVLVQSDRAFLLLTQIMKGADYKGLLRHIRHY